MFSIAIINSNPSLQRAYSNVPMLRTGNGNLTFGPSENRPAVQITRLRVDVGATPHGEITRAPAPLAQDHKRRCLDSASRESGAGNKARGPCSLSLGYWLLRSYWASFLSVARNSSLSCVRARRSSRRSVASVGLGELAPIMAVMRRTSQT